MSRIPAIATAGAKRPNHRCLSPTRGRLRALLVMAAGVWLTIALPAQESESSDPTVRELRSLSLDELMNMEVTTVNKKEQKLSTTAAAIYVVTSDDIRRSGATTIPDVLRTVPGLNVAQMDSHQWAISARGFNDIYANKLLVMMDGRSVYTPLYSGVNWDVQDTLLEDIDRIEVIRGPGGSIWGANAVNGVINIITRSAKDTQGSLISIGGGNPTELIAAARHGFQISESSWGRVFGKYSRHDDLEADSGDSANDAYDVVRGGFRVDWEPSDSVLTTLQGDVYGGEFNQTVVVPNLSPPYQTQIQDTPEVAGANLLGRWTRQFAGDDSFSIQSYLDYSSRDNATLIEDRLTYDLDLSHHVDLGMRHRVSWGMGYRLYSDDLEDPLPVLRIGEKSRIDHLFSSFVQDEIQLVEDRLVATVGSKFEHNDYTGFEIQPNVRLQWSPVANHHVWGSVSRAVRTPSRIEDNGYILTRVVPPGGFDPVLPTAFSAVGNAGYDSEEVIAYELGYRFQPVAALSFDVVGFFNDFENIRSVQMMPPVLQPGPPAHLEIQNLIVNERSREGYGAELSTSWQATEGWRLRANYTYHHMKGREGDHTDRDYAPDHQASLQSYLNLPWNMELDGTLRYVDSIPSLSIDSYLTLDLRLGWRPRENVEVSVTGMNLLEGRHSEFRTNLVPYGPTGLIERSVFAKLVWEF